MVKLFARYSALFIFLALQSPLIAQNYSRHNWFFGNSTDAIIFNKSDNEPMWVDVQGTPFGSGGSAVATDPLTGDVLFYTDGLTIYDASHNTMPDGFGLNGNTISNQQVGICPDPADSTRYFIFTNSASSASAGNMEYTIVSMALPGNAGMFAPNLGNVEAGIKNVATPITNTSEAMVVIPKPGFNGCWVVTQVRGTNQYRAYDVATGNTVQSSAGPPLIAANFSYTPGDGGKIAVAPLSTNRNVVVLDFNNTTGNITFQQEIANTGNNDGSEYAVYDTEWAADGLNLYISRYGSNSNPTGQLLQFDPNVPNVQTVVGNLSRSLGLRLGPDDRIYHLYEVGSGQSLVGWIDQPQQVLDSIGYDPIPSDIGNINYNGRQFPEFAFARRTSNTNMFMVTGECTNGPTQFFPQVDPTAERFNWIIGGTSSNELAPSVVFSSGGPITVSMRYFINDQLFTYDSTINITQSDLQAQLADTIICPGQSVVLDPMAQSGGGGGGGAGGGLFNYFWHDKSTGPTFTTDTAGVYWVVVEDQLNPGCKVYTSAEVTVCGEQDMRSAVWYFGQNAGYNFNDPQQAISGPMVAPEGTSTISDRNGNVLFYTNGETVWNREGNVMPNGTDIGGTPGSVNTINSTQSAVIVPYPNDETLFYIFITEEVVDQDGLNSYIMGYAVVDIKEDMGLGDVVIKNKPLFERSTERVAAFTGSDSTWVIGHEWGTNTFRAYPVHPGGIGNPVLSSAGAIHGIGSPDDAQGYMNFSPAGNQIAVAIQGQNAVEIFDFADSTGMVENPLRVDLNESPYGVYFSANHLFVTTLQGALYRIRMDTTDAAIENTPPLEVFRGGVALGAIQQSPTGQLLVAREGQGSLGQIIGADAPDNQVGFQEDGLQLAGGTSSGLGLPNFIQNLSTPISGATMFVDQFCLEDPTTFSGTGPCQSLDNFLWQVRPQGIDSVIYTSVQMDTEFQFTNPGFYDVSLNVNNCDLAFDTTMFQTIEISGRPVLDSIPAFVPLCNGSATITAASADTVGLSFLWSPTGDTTNTVTITQPGSYSVTVTNQAGCSNSSNFLANPVNPAVNLGPDRIYCINDQADSLNAENPNSSFQWVVTLDGSVISTPADTSRIMDVATDLPGDYLYVVNVTDNITACTTSDSVNVQVLPPPSLTATPTDSPGCNQANGSIDVDIISTGSFTIEVTDGNNIVSDTSSGPGQVNIPNLTAGVYSVNLIDNVSQCRETLDGIVIQDQNANFISGSEIVPTTCDLDDGVIRIFIPDPLVFPINYILRDQATNGQISMVNGVGSTPFPNGDGFEITGLIPGTYAVEVTSTTNGCTESLADLVVDTDNDNIDLFTPEFAEGCGPIATFFYQTSGQLNNVAGPPGANITTTQNSITVDQPGLYTVTAEDNPGGLLCDSIRTVEVSLAEIILIQIDTAAQDCSGSRILTANVTNPDPTLTYTYQWYEGSPVSGTRIDGAVARQHSITVGGTYSVRVGTQENVCESEATISDVQLRPPLLVELEAFSDCDNQAATIIQANVNQPNVELIWFDPGGIEIPGTRDLPSINVNERGNFSVLVTNTVQGVQCSALESISLFDICPPQIFAHSAIRPDSRLPENRTFYIHNPNDIADEFQVFIFNRWGEMIFESSDKNFAWNGTYRGEDVPVGTYPYLIRYKLPDDPEVFEKRGGVAVVR